ncbi:hypothetical protein COCNU_07G008490 [Cocos nucifera]|uniref:Uncharacterized protein n=1 Tax=Cocos nucifera TaxID=13894 RepID=A0A8K0IFY1_COCNU|nr:hypothetical protein COCNU_07G008490 [Cocos nucifera]
MPTELETPKGTTAIAAPKKRKLKHKKSKNANKKLKKEPQPWPPLPPSSKPQQEDDQAIQEESQGVQLRRRRLRTADRGPKQSGRQRSPPGSRGCRLKRRLQRGGGRTEGFGRGAWSSPGARGLLKGPILSAHKKLVAKKLAEEEAEHKIKGEAKKEEHLVSKAQNPQKGLNPSKSKDAKGFKFGLQVAQISGECSQISNPSSNPIWFAP